MFRLSQKADYGLILLSNISKSKTPISVAKIAAKNQIPAKFLSQIATELKKAGYIKAKEGARGGYVLAKSATQIRLLDVLKTLDGELVVGKCFEEDHECHWGGKALWQDLKRKL